MRSWSGCKVEGEVVVGIVMVELDIEDEVEVRLRGCSRDGEMGIWGWMRGRRVRVHLG